MKWKACLATKVVSLRGWIFWQEKAACDRMTALANESASEENMKIRLSLFLAHFVMACAVL